MPPFRRLRGAIAAYLFAVVGVGYLLRTGLKPVTENCFLNSAVEHLSQFTEDATVFEAFYELPLKCDGVVVEMGGLDGRTYSNSWFFQYALNWRALLVEALPDNYEKMLVNRPDATNVFGAICPGKSITFLTGRDPATGGGAKDMSEGHQKTWTNENSTLVEVPCMLMPAVFKKHGIKHVDLFILDVEGGELTVLETFDWKVRINIFVVEMDGSNPKKDEAVRQLLHGRQYVTPFSMFDECKKRIEYCLPNEIFVLKKIADRYFYDATQS